MIGHNTDGPGVGSNPSIENLSDGYGQCSEHFERESLSQRIIDWDLLGIETVAQDELKRDMRY